MLHIAWIETPIGRLLAGAQDNAVVHLEFVDDAAEEALAELRGRFAIDGVPCDVVSGKSDVLRQLKEELAEYFAGTRRDFAVAIAPRGTPFEKRAWEFLCAIPYGQTRSYGQQARAVGSPAAARAVGRANGCNNIVIVIPCHRVIGADGSLTGFGAGIERKRWLLDHEKAVSGQRKPALFATV